MLEPAVWFSYFPVAKCIPLAIGCAGMHYRSFRCNHSRFANAIMQSSRRLNQTPCRPLRIFVPTAPDFFIAAERLHLALCKRDLAVPRCIPSDCATCSSEQSSKSHAFNMNRYLLLPRVATGREFAMRVILLRDVYIPGGSHAESSRLSFMFVKGNPANVLLLFVGERGIDDDGV